MVLKRICTNSHYNCKSLRCIFVRIRFNTVCLPIPLFFLVPLHMVVVGLLACTLLVTYTTQPLLPFWGVNLVMGKHLVLVLELPCTGGVLTFYLCLLLANKPNMPFAIFHGKECFCASFICIRALDNFIFS